MRRWVIFLESAVDAGTDIQQASTTNSGNISDQTTVSEHMKSSSDSDSPQRYLATSAVDEVEHLSISAMLGRTSRNSAPGEVLVVQQTNRDSEIGHDIDGNTAERR